MADTPMTAEVRAHYDAIKSSAELVSEVKGWDIVQYARNADGWFCQMITDDGPKTFHEDSLTAAAQEMRQYAERIKHAQFDTGTMQGTPIVNDDA